MLVKTRLPSRPSATLASVYRAAALGRAVGTQVTQVASRETRGPNSWAAGAPVSLTRPSAWAACWRAAALRRCLKFSSAQHSQVSRWRWGGMGEGPVAGRGLSHSRAVLFTRSRCLLKVSLLTEPSQHAEWNGLSFPVFVDADLLLSDCFPGHVVSQARVLGVGPRSCRCPWRLLRCGRVLPLSFGGTGVEVVFVPCSGLGCALQGRSGVGLPVTDRQLLPCCSGTPCQLSVPLSNVPTPRGAWLPCPPAQGWGGTCLSPWTVASLQLTLSSSPLHASAWPLSAAAAFTRVPRVCARPREKGSLCLLRLARFLLLSHLEH